MPIIKSAGLPLAGGTMSGDVVFADNISVLLGTGSDGNLYHDGTNTYFKNATGNIYIENDTIDGDIIFKVNDGGVDTTVMTLDGATSNVGIGTTSPNYKLEVNGSLATTGTASQNAAYLASVAGGSGRFGYQLRLKNLDAPTVDFFLGQQSDDSLRFATWDGGTLSDKVTISATGNVGIGTTGPESALHVIGKIAVGANTAQVPLYALTVNSGGTAATGLGLMRANSTQPMVEIYETTGDGKLAMYTATTKNIFFDTVGSSWINGGNVGIGTTGPTNLLSLTGQSAKTIWSERNSTAATPGQNLTVRVGGAVAGGTNLGGGSLILAGGTSTGTGTSTVLLQTCPAGSTGTADNALATMLEITGNKFSVFGVTAVVRATALTAADASALNTGDATSDTVIANMRTRIGELESKLTAYGLLT